MGCHTPEGRPCIPRNPLGYSTGCRRHRSTNGGSTPFLVTDSSEQMNNPQTTPIWDFPEHTRYPPPTERSPTKVASSFLFFLSVKFEVPGPCIAFLRALRKLACLTAPLFDVQVLY